MDRTTGNVLIALVAAVVIVFVAFSFALFNFQERIAASSPTITEIDGVYQLNWIEVNPPSGVTGPCFAYFDRTLVGSGAYGFSGIVCPYSK